MKNRYWVLAGVCSTLLVASSCFSQKASGGDKISGMISEKQPLVFKQETFNAPVHFVNVRSAVPEAGSVYRQEVAGAVSFKNCVFKEDVLAYQEANGMTYLCSFGQQVSFDSCVFYGDVNFRGSMIAGVANFTNCKFLKGANFEEVQCMSNTRFVKSFFDGAARFQNAYFNRGANFLDAVFDSTASFQSAHFNQDAQFSASKFWRYADFSLCQFRQGLFFNYAALHERAVFNNSMFNDRAEFLKTSFGMGVQMKECRFMGMVKFDGVEVAESFDLGKSVFFSGKPEVSTVKGTVSLEQAKVYNGTLVN